MSYTISTSVQDDDMLRDVVEEPLWWVRRSELGSIWSQQGIVVRVVAPTEDGKECCRVGLPSATVHRGLMLP